MFHPDTQFLIDHWSALVGRDDARVGIPARAALHPDALGLRLPRAFLVDRSGDETTLRLAGGWLEAFHGEGLKGRDLLSLWTTQSHGMLAAALSQTIREGRPVVVSARVGQASAPIEVSLAPLRGPFGRTDCILGLYAPLKTLTLAADESRLLTARVSLGVGEATRAPLSLAAVGGRRLA